MSKCKVFSGPYFPVFGLNTGKYGPEKTPTEKHFSCSVCALEQWWGVMNNKLFFTEQQSRYIGVRKEKETAKSQRKQFSAKTGKIYSKYSCYGLFSTYFHLPELQN